MSAAVEKSYNSNSSLSNGCSYGPNDEASTKSSVPDRPRPNGTTQLSKFKEKRPEPLKLNPNLNQEIPLDLSVKSAGNVPSGTLDSIFSSLLVASSSGHQLQATLETPRIVWQDNEALLMKPRLFCASTGVGQRARLSPLAGDSPPITPGTPYMDLIYSPTVGNSLPLSAGCLLSNCDSPTFKHQIQTSTSVKFQQNQLKNQNKSNGRPPNQLQGRRLAALRQSEPTAGSSTIRRTCSSENLSALNKANSRSARLGQAFRFQRRTAQSNADSMQIATATNSTCTAINTTTSSATNDTRSTKNNNKFSYGAPSESSPSGSQALTPTSLASATANLLNISLSSPSKPNGEQSEGATYCPRHTSEPLQLPRSPLGTGLNSATLNTPTLVSPSQLRAGAPISFLPSPTLSPMAGVFELPSPLLVYSAASVAATSGGGELPVGGEKPNERTSENLSHLITKAADKLASRTGGEVNSVSEVVAMEVAETFACSPEPGRTSARPTSSSVGVAGELERVVVASAVSSQADQAHQPRPATVIPRILVSSSQALPTAASPSCWPQLETIHSGANAPSSANGTNAACGPQQRTSQREPHGKRALSPQSFRNKVSLYHSERLESCSAPPDVHRGPRARSKLKSATELAWPNLPAVQALGIQSNAISTPSRITYQRCSQPYPTERWTPSTFGPSACASSYSVASRPAYTLEAPQSASAGELYRAPLAPLGQPIRAPTSSLGQLNTSAQSNQSCVLPALQPHLDSSLCWPAQRPSRHQHQFTQSHPHPHSNQNQNQSQRQNHHHNQSHSHGHNQNQNQDQNPNQDQNQNQNQNNNQIQNEKQQMSTTERRPFLDQTPAAAIQSLKTININPSGLVCNTSGHYTTNESQVLSSSGAVSAPRRYHCDRCPKAFTRSDMLTRHRRLHSGDRPFQCNECKQEFSRSDHLSTHMRTHTGEKPYKCKLCSYSACRKDMITRHMKVHNRSSPMASSLHLLAVSSPASSNCDSISR